MRKYFNWLNVFVSLHTERVGWNQKTDRTRYTVKSLSPHGESGLKYVCRHFKSGVSGSLSTRREWVEMTCSKTRIPICWSLSPHGESGLKYPIVYVTKRFTSLSPHGESGLKYGFLQTILWYYLVSLHTERVGWNIVKITKRIHGNGLSPHGESGLK